MNTTPPTTNSTMPVPDRRKLISALGNPIRWDMLQELSIGEPLMVSELAQRVGCSLSLASKHMQVLLKAGLVLHRRRLYQIPPQHLPQPGTRVVDYGHCLLRLPYSA